MKRIGKVYTTVGTLNYFKHHYRENLMVTDYQANVGADEIITGGAGCGKTWELRRRVLASRNPLLLSFTNKTVQNAKEKIKTVAAIEGGVINHNLDAVCGDIRLFILRKQRASSSCATNMRSSKSLAWCQTNGSHCYTKLMSNTATT